RLKCEPEVEARTFDGGKAHRTFDHLGEVTVEVTVAMSGDGGPPAQVAPLVAAALPAGPLERHPGLAHFGPIDDPAATAAAARAALGLGSGVPEAGTGDAYAAAMAFPVPRTLSPSKVTTFTDCALAFRFSAIDRLPEPPTVAATRGTLVHSALERLHLLP